MGQRSRPKTEYNFIQSRGYSRTLSTSGAIFRVATGEPRIQSETVYPGVSVGVRDISCFGYEQLRLFPSHLPVPPANGPLSALSAGAVSSSLGAIDTFPALDSLPGA